MNSFLYILGIVLLFMAVGWLKNNRGYKKDSSVVEELENKLENCCDK